MTLAEILSNEELRRHEFPVAREKIFLGHAGVCPLPRRVAEAIRDYATPTTLALSFVASGLPWRKHDNILIYHDDYPSNVYPWMALAERGVQVRFMNVRELGRIRAVDVQGQVDEQTRLVALASCHFVSGWRIDLAGIGQYLHGRGIAFCVDGIQTLRAVPTTGEPLDFLAADAHKWLLGPCAAGIF